MILPRKGELHPLFWNTLPALHLANVPWLSSKCPVEKKTDLLPTSRNWHSSKPGSHLQSKPKNYIIVHFPSAWKEMSTASRQGWKVRWRTLPRLPERWGHGSTGAGREGRCQRTQLHMWLLEKGRAAGRRLLGRPEAQDKEGAKTAALVPEAHDHQELGFPRGSRRSQCDLVCILLCVPAGRVRRRCPKAAIFQRKCQGGLSWEDPAWGALIQEAPLCLQVSAFSSRLSFPLIFKIW